ncbi:U32 family peptidase [Candidatus Falkowbacteria bacterium]|jgi:U32 family peptidase|nr:U32 family peptidase [Candidatus Falkowbacteria bacterium]MBT6573941.1 U32 family peptidase [Candidatus Falkowbacteria bacterium]MBT7348351.1 U32 family peptidase [Candidatus Falkowbacteria bacterium]MBT7500264.1 U32 family peptidase [Candidatus Falkowbacteria bacterium]
MKQIELLAPAGDLNKLKIAFAFGADAVYCGLPDFSLRVRINQFDLAKLSEGIEYAHALGKKVYVTINIYAHNKHLLNLDKYIDKLKQLKPDGLIISDPGVLSVVKNIWPSYAKASDGKPGIAIHLSTQANCTNWQSAKFWYDQGVKRIILGREVTLEEIKEIHAKVPEVELETFVHGAMCMSYSGRCLLSKYFNDRSANLGDCTQPCRWQYKIKKEKKKEIQKVIIEEMKRPDDLLIIEEDQHGSYIMNSKDLCLVEHLQELKDAGVMSFKIEGRAKSIYYVGNTTRVYRRAIDALKEQESKGKYQGKGKDQRIKNKDNEKYLVELKKAQNRGFTAGFLFGKDECEQKIDKCHEDCDWEFCGQVIEVGAKLNSAQSANHKMACVKVHNQIKVGDDVEFVVPVGENLKYKVEKILDEEKNEISEAHGGQDKNIYLPIEKELPEHTLLRRKLKII